MADLLQKKCAPCEGGTPPLSDERVRELLPQAAGWDVVDAALRRTFRFRDFREAMVFVGRVADLAEQEQHHPDIAISWNKVTLALTTHAIRGLSENDFILAAKINEMRA